MAELVCSAHIGWTNGMRRSRRDGGETVSPRSALIALQSPLL
jgi:hypothetical protein